MAGGKMERWLSSDAWGKPNFKESGKEEDDWSRKLAIKSSLESVQWLNPNMEGFQEGVYGKNSSYCLYYKNSKGYCFLKLKLWGNSNAVAELFTHELNVILFLGSN